jgi:lipid-binding SYLF domain-containing protein
MKKFMVADLIKAVEQKEDYSQYKEYNPDMGPNGSISLGSLGDADFQFDTTNDNYQVDIYFKDGSEAKGYVLSGSELSDLNDNGATYYNNNIRVGKPDNKHWPFGSLDHLHWPNQIGK